MVPPDEVGVPPPLAQHAGRQLTTPSTTLRLVMREPCREANKRCRSQTSCQRRICSVPGAPARAQPVQLASLEVVTQSSSSTGLPQYVSLAWGLATCTLPIPFACRTFIYRSPLSAACTLSLTRPESQVVDVVAGQRREDQVATGGLLLAIYLFDRPGIWPFLKASTKSPWSFRAIAA